MNKRFFLWSILFILASGIVFTRLQIVRYNKALADGSQPISEQQYAEISRHRLGADATPPAALVPLELNRSVRLALGSLGLRDEEANSRLSDLVLTELSGAQGLNLVERQSLEKVLGELNLSLSRFVRAKDAVRVGKLLKADWILLGTGAKINGSNSIVIRLVDARTGILCDAGVFASDKRLPQLAGDVANFVRETRQNAAGAKVPVFLAIGTFEDLSVNNRQAGFPTQLRGYLTAAYRGGKVTLLEREYVEALLQEVHLDQAGLTVESATETATPMQSAYWLVSGSYQSLETTSLQVEVALDVQRIFGLAKHVSLRGEPGEALNQQIHEAIDTLMNQNHGVIVPTRNSEIHLQLNTGKELARVNRFAGTGDLGLWYNLDDWNNVEEYGQSNPQKGVKRRRNLEEALRAFETVLLLDPGNREAKLCLGTYLSDPLIGRIDEGRACYREIMDAREHDEWSGLAKKGLLNSFLNWMGAVADASERARWFESAALQSTNSSVRDFYEKQAKESQVAAAIAQGGTGKATALVEQRLLDNLQSYDNLLHGKPGGSTEELGMYDFVHSYSPDPAVSARRLVELIPNMRSRVPELEPYFMAMVVRFQVDTNVPVIVEFQRELAQISEHPNQVLAPKLFWGGLLPLCYWSFDHKLHLIVALVMEGKQRAASQDKSFPTIYHSESEERIALAFAYMGLQRWQQARDIFETFSNQSVFMFEHGPWGTGLNTVLPDKEATFCAQKLGQAPTHDVREFDLGKPCFGLCTSAVMLDETGLWMGMNSRLLHVDFDLTTNLAVTLPGNSGTPVCLCPTASAVWIGTDGEGLIEFDKTSHQCRRITEQDGLLMNNVACLKLAGPNLWIGYGHRTYAFWGMGIGGEGGLGRLNLSTGKFTSFTPSLEDRKLGLLEASDKPTRHPVIVLAQGAEDDVWMVTEENGTRLRHYRARDNTWEAGPQTSSSLAVDSKGLFLGQYWNYTGGDQSDQLGVRILGFNDGKWRFIKTISGLPTGSVSALASDGHCLWVGGRSYIAVVDLEKDEIRKFTRINAVAVDQMQIGGGYLWARFDCNLYRVPLSIAE